MKVEDIATLMGDRVLVEKLGMPKKIGSFFVPENASTSRDRKAIWWGRVVKFGLDSRALEGYALSVGDIIGIDPVAKDCTTMEFEGKEYVHVPDEFIAAKDEDGSVGRAYGIA